MKKYIRLSICLLTCMSPIIGQSQSADVMLQDLVTDGQVSEDATRSCKPKCDACPPKDTCCTRLQCRTIIRDLDELLACAAIPVTCAPGQTEIPINNPGTYCLENDITCNIVLNSSQVTLDLNGHTVNGVIYTANGTFLKNLVITNGIINVPNNMNGITISGIDDIQFVDNCLIEDVAIYCNGNCTTNPATGGTRGIFIEHAREVSLSHLFIRGAVLANLHIESAGIITIEESDFVSSCSVGCLIGQNTLVLNFSITDCSFTNNQHTGLFINKADAGNTLTSCVFSNNTNGIFLSVSTVSTLLSKCLSSFNQYGFLLEAPEASLVDCMSSVDNKAGFLVIAASTQPIALLTFENCQTFASECCFEIFNANNVSLRNCFAQTAFDLGFYIHGTASVISLNSCEAQSCSQDCFLINDTAQVTLINCTAQSSTGSANGFHIGSNANASLKQCTATYNAGNGFLDETGFGSASSYASCFAKGNGNGMTTFNYNPSPAPFFEVPLQTAGTGYWYNVFA